MAEIAYFCEHQILGVSCGRMDQYASSLGGIFHLNSHKDPNIIPLDLNREALFVIGNSNIERKADFPLKTVQEKIFDALRIMKSPNLSELTLKAKQVKILPKYHKKKLLGVIGVRDNTLKAFNELKKKEQDLEYLGTLISEQQKFLKNNYEVSHPKLDKMCEISEKKGALGAKLTGAGFGGCMFALCTDRNIALRIKDQLQKIGTAFITKIDSGVRED
jgi:galactokinase